METTESVYVSALVFVDMYPIAVGVATRTTSAPRHDHWLTRTLRLQPLLLLLLRLLLLCMNAPQSAHTPAEIDGTSRDVGQKLATLQVRIDFLPWFNCSSPFPSAPNLTFPSLSLPRCSGRLARGRGPARRGLTMSKQTVSGSTFLLPPSRALDRSTHVHSLTHARTFSLSLSRLSRRLDQTDQEYSRLSTSHASESCEKRRQGGPEAGEAGASAEEGRRWRAGGSGSGYGGAGGPGQEAQMMGSVARSNQAIEDIWTGRRLSCRAWAPSAIG